MDFRLPDAGRQSRCSVKLHELKKNKSLVGKLVVSPRSKLLRKACKQAENDIQKAFHEINLDEDLKFVDFLKDLSEIVNVPSSRSTKYTEQSNKELHLT